MMRSLSILSGIFTALLLSFTVDAAVVTIPVLEDTNSKEEKANDKKSGTKTTIEVSNKAGKGRIGFLKFEVTGLSGTVTNALLYLNSPPAKKKALDEQLDVFQVADNSWTETTLTWNNQPAIGAAIASATPPAALGWFNVDTTTYITGNGTYSMAMGFGGNNGKGVLSAYEDTGFGAYLEITYNLPPVWTIDPTVKVNATSDAAYNQSLSVDATDPESDFLSFAKTVGPTWLNIATDGSLTGTPTSSDIGLNSFTITVSDGINAAVPVTMEITVDAPADTLPPTPNPMIFAVAPAATGETSISMTAATATDVSGVEYYFTNTAGSGNDSGWQSSPSYTDSGLTASTLYSYTVTARDLLGNTGSVSSASSITTNAPPDTTAPTPNPMSFAVTPAATGETSISMTAIIATDASGVEYYFENTAGGGNDSGWQSSVSYTNTGLTAGTSYSYRVKSRDTSAAQNEATWSATSSVTTDATSDTTPPTPNPMSFMVPPLATGETTILMVASTATDPSDVEYYFANTAGGGNDSGWQSGQTYTDSGLTAGTLYSYTVTARDLIGNVGTASGVASATTDAAASSDYDNWAARYLPAVLGAGTADFDNDGKNNDQERFFGTDPTTGGSSNPITGYDPASRSFI